MSGMQVRPKHPSTESLEVTLTSDLGKLRLPIPGGSALLSLHYPYGDDDTDWIQKTQTQSLQPCTIPAQRASCDPPAV